MEAFFILLILGIIAFIITLIYCLIKRTQTDESENYNCEDFYSNENPQNENNDSDANTETEHEQNFYTSPRNDNMKTCKICGQPIETNIICPKCLQKVNNNEISECAYCGGFFLTGTKCNCILDKEKEEKTQQNININVSNETEEKEEPGCFTKGCTGTLGVGCGIFILIGLMIFAIIMGIWEIFK